MESAHGTMGREKKAGASLLRLSPSHRAPRVTNRVLQRRELQLDATITGERAYKPTFTVALQRSSKQMLKMMLTSAQLTSKTFSGA